MSTEAMPPLPEPWADTINGWAYTAEQMHLYARTYAADLERRLQEAGKPPDVLFDGFAVLSALTPQARQRTSPENVADTLDAIVRLMRSAAAAAAGKE